MSWHSLCKSLGQVVSLLTYPELNHIIVCMYVAPQKMYWYPLNFLRTSKAQIRLMTRGHCTLSIRIGGIVTVQITWQGHFFLLFPSPLPLPPSPPLSHRFPFFTHFHFLPARASEQGNVIGLVSVYIYMSSKKNCN